MKDIETEKRIYQVGQLIRRKPTSFVVEYIGKQWGIEKSQAYNYIRAARKEWRKYFANMKSSGVGYHVAQNRDLKDKARTDGDYKLAFDIAKEEAKLMGVYPAEKHEEIRKIIRLGVKETDEEKDEEE